MKLDLGCGQHVRPGYQGVDIAALPDVVQTDLMKPWPWEDSSIDGFSSNHFIEHIPLNLISDRIPKDPFFFFFDEAYRVAKPDAIFEVIWPALQSVRAFQDPTHRRFIPVETMHYLNFESRINMGVDHYNVNCNWEVMLTEYSCNQKVVELMGKDQALYAWNVMIDGKCKLRAIKNIVL